MHFLLFSAIIIIFYSNALATGVRPSSYPRHGAINGANPASPPKQPSCMQEGNVKPAWHAKPLPSLEIQPIYLHHDGEQLQGIQQQNDENFMRQTGVLGVMKPAPPGRNERNPYFENEIQMQRFQDLRMEEETQHLSPGGIQRKPIPMNGYNQAQFRKPMPLMMPQNISLAIQRSF
jgi:hypothetical protein